MLSESVTVRSPLSALDPVGLKVTLMLQDALAVNVPGQVFVWLKTPVVAMLEI